MIGFKKNKRAEKLKMLSSKIIVKARNANCIKTAQLLGLRISGSIPMIKCLFHDDMTPSMSLYKDHAYCFGACGKVYNAIDMVMAQRIPFLEAVDKIVKFVIMNLKKGDNIFDDFLIGLPTKEAYYILYREPDIISQDAKTQAYMQKRESMGRAEEYDDTLEGCTYDEREHPGGHCNGQNCPGARPMGRKEAYDGK